MDRQIDNNTVFVSATEPILYAGCDFRLLLGGGRAVLHGGGLPVRHPSASQLLSMPWESMHCSFPARAGDLQQLAKSDPLAMQVYLRHIRWPAWLPAHGKILKTRGRMKVLKRT